jgi:hypothetical protein
VFLADHMLEAPYAQPIKKLVLASHGSGNARRTARLVVLVGRHIAARQRICSTEPLVAF